MQKAKTARRRRKWQRGLVSHQLQGGGWEISYLTTKKESEKFKIWGLAAEGLRDHTAIDGSPKGIPGRHGVCGWSVGQLDHDGELESMHGHIGLTDTKDVRCKERSDEWT